MSELVSRKDQSRIFFHFQDILLFKNVITQKS